MEVGGKIFKNLQSGGLYYSVLKSKYCRSHNLKCQKKNKCVVVVAATKTMYA